VDIQDKQVSPKANPDAEKLLSELKISLNSNVSDSQYLLMQQVERHLHDIDKPDPEDPSIEDTLETLMIDIEQQHPKAAIIVKEILKVLQDIGI
jgi:hypothetical protein